MRFFSFIFGFLLLFMPLEAAGTIKDDAGRECVALTCDSIMKLSCILTTYNTPDTFCTFTVSLKDDFQGRLCLNELNIRRNNLRVILALSDTLMELYPALEKDLRSCLLLSDMPLKKDECRHVTIPEGLFEIKPDYVEVEEMDIDDELLSSFSVAGAWHVEGSPWKSQGMFSVIDDDSIDGQIESSKHDRYTYGYYSLLYPLLESLGLKGNLAVEGRKIGINENPYFLNDNGKTILRFQNEKGWDILSHSMDCLGDIENNWVVDSLTSPLAREIFEKGPNMGLNAYTVSVYDLTSEKQYWPNADNTEWEETPPRYIKPYASDYHTGMQALYNNDFCIDWHWGEWKRRAEEFGINAVGFVTHNSTSSHAMVPGIMEVFPFGFSDVGTININTPPMLSTGVRAGLEGQSMEGYDGNSRDNKYNKKQYKAFCAQIDETAKLGGWIVFNLHTYRDCWLNQLPGKLVSEGGSYPDEWVIPMKGMDSANDSLSPPAHLGISDWSQWHPCPGTRLEMLSDILKYAKKKGLKNVTCSEGFQAMGNKKSLGYFNSGYRIGMDYLGLIDTKDIYPHYVVSATDEVYYYNPLTSDEITRDFADIPLEECRNSDKTGKFLFGKGRIYWSAPNPTGITLKLYNLTGLEMLSIESNQISLSDVGKGVYVLCAVHSGSILGAVKVVK